MPGACAPAGASLAAAGSAGRSAAPAAASPKERRVNSILNLPIMKEYRARPSGFVRTLRVMRWRALFDDATQPQGYGQGERASFGTRAHAGLGVPVLRSKKIERQPAFSELDLVGLFGPQFVYRARLVPKLELLDHRDDLAPIEGARE